MTSLQLQKKRWRLVFKLNFFTFCDGLQLVHIHDHVRSQSVCTGHLTGGNLSANSCSLTWIALRAIALRETVESLQIIAIQFTNADI